MHREVHRLIASLAIDADAWTVWQAAPERIVPGFALDGDEREAVLSAPRDSLAGFAGYLARWIRRQAWPASLREQVA